MTSSPLSLLPVILYLFFFSFLFFSFLFFSFLNPQGVLSDTRKRSGQIKRVLAGFDRLLREERVDERRDRGVENKAG